MRLTKFGHACVRLEDEGRRLVIDPGTYTEPESLDGADAILVSHEHEDHADVDQIAAACAANPDLIVHGPTGWADTVRGRLGDAVIGVSSGDDFEAAGFGVRAVGGRHAEIIDGLPGCPNLGYVVEGIYHPGDSLFVPEADVEVLLVPVSGPWLKHRDAIELMRAIRPSRAIPIHDSMLSDLGLANVDAWLEGEGGADYTRVAPGATVTVSS
ncbi:MBL fold metallo-hydrolase [Nocardioides pocheonensis]|uniref:MBL fold metallo-hydrolase n=1 Tax=Nocardioides pocheonensis TaxID=661485 RepID=A0A3N0GV75_9ACTN|nr:MBL fold metallo-hydrolase [Nocardioides pocheonensis]RNM16373.1 MBL fold metallo-hydrolase [Nocardioides pocheonensis]